MALRVASLPPQCIPFETPELFEDDFARADGNLIGRNGWVASELADPSPLIVSASCRPGAAGTFSASQPGVFAGVAGTGTWWIEIDAIIGTPSLLPSAVGVWWGDVTSQALYVELTANTGIGGGHNLQVDITDASGANQTTLVTLGTPTASHTFRLMSNGTDLLLQIDGVTVATFAGADLTTPGNDQLDIFFDRTAGGPQIQVTVIEAYG